MARLLLDTSFLVDAERNRDELESVIADDDDVAISAVTLAELDVGVHLASGRRRAARRRFVDAVRHGIPVVVYDERVAETHGELLAEVRRIGEPRGAHDLIIAATARSSGREIVTSNARGFLGLPGVVVRDG